MKNIEAGIIRELVEAVRESDLYSDLEPRMARAIAYLNDIDTPRRQMRALWVGPYTTTHDEDDRCAHLGCQPAALLTSEQDVKGVARDISTDGLFDVHYSRGWVAQEPTSTISERAENVKPHQTACDVWRLDHGYDDCICERSESAKGDSE